MKFNFKALCLLSVTSVILMSSCESENHSASDVKTTNEQSLKVDQLFDSNSTLKREFGKALMKTLNESKSLRDLIKNESLKMFDNDYEVLYQLIKNERLENNLTLRENILKNLGSKDLLNKIELNNPTLTILVPELPENSFSAKTWNTDTQIPQVAIRLSTSNDVPVINLDGSEYIIEGQYTPAFPIIVLKDNERIIANSRSTNKSLKTQRIGDINGDDYQFLDDCFDGSKTRKNKTSRNVSSTSLDSKLLTAYNTYENVDGWQRDYIYYGISPASPNGPFSYDFQESLRSFTLQGDAMGAYNKIADQTEDTKIVGIKKSLNASSWTGGNFEFKVKIIVNGKNGIGSEIVKYFTATGDNLFDISYKKMNSPFVVRYAISGISLKQMDLNIPIFNWDLNQYASTIKIEIEEVDLTETTVTTDTRSVKFATNFSLDATLKKIGLKFGASLEKNETSTVQKTFTQGNDQLGEVIVNFADKFIISNSGSTYTTREYSSGLYSISVEPVRVQ